MRWAAWVPPLLKLLQVKPRGARFVICLSGVLIYLLERRPQSRAAAGPVAVEACSDAGKPVCES